MLDLPQTDIDKLAGEGRRPRFIYRLKNRCHYYILYPLYVLLDAAISGSDLEIACFTGSGRMLSVIIHGVYNIR
jgi:hypothetical protein